MMAIFADGMSHPPFVLIHFVTLQKILYGLYCKNKYQIWWPYWMTILQQSNKNWSGDLQFVWMGINATFNNISVILLQSVLLAEPEEAGVPGETHWHFAGYWQTLSRLMQVKQNQDPHVTY